MNTNLILLQFVGTNFTATPFSGAQAVDAVTSYNELAKAWGPICIGILAILATFGAQLLLIRHQRKQFERQSDSAREQFEKQNQLAKQNLDLSRSEGEIGRAHV